MHWFHKTSITAMPDYVKWNTKKKIISKCYFLILIKNPKSDIREATPTLHLESNTLWLSGIYSNTIRVINIRKSTNIIFHFNWLRKKSLMFSHRCWNRLWQNQLPFLIKAHNKIGMSVFYLNIINYIYMCLYLYLYILKF